MKLALPVPFGSSPAARVAIGLVSLMVALVLLTDLFIGGFLPDRAADARRQRLLTAELVGTQVTHALRPEDESELRTLLTSTLRHDPELRSLAVVGAGRQVVVGHAAAAWLPGPDDPPTLDNLRVPLLVDGRPWGRLQLAFAPAAPQGVAGWLRDPAIGGLILMAVTGFFAFQLYLRRAMRYLDPSAAVPERVRTAFDTLTEGVLVLDRGGHVMLANRALLDMAPEGATADTGASVAEMTWLVAALPSRVDLPWQRALDGNASVLGLHLSLGAGTPQAREMVLNCTPINDGFRRARGCLLTFSDVTELHASREALRRKNEELTLLATRDALTGCLNRRAFMAESDRCLDTAAATRTPLACIMCDVDHFKAINDRFGHGGGDEVLKAVAHALGRGLRTGDLVGRYGGEEFCIVLPDATLDQALEIAERLRAEVEANAGSAVRQFADVKVTMSFGVEQFDPARAQFAALLDRADQALYHSKKTGRNRVTAYTTMPHGADAAA